MQKGNRRTAIARSRLVKIVLAAGQMLIVTAAARAAPFDPRAPQARPAETFQFDAIAPFLKFSDAFGDRTQPGPHGTFGIIPAHTASPPHTHSAVYHGVVIRGVIVNPFNGDQYPPHLGPGSYRYVPANVVHVTACISDEPCLFYTHLEAPFDVKLTGQ